MNAAPARFFDRPPYKAVEYAPGVAGVENALGSNVLTFPDKPGAVLTNLPHATAIADEWNSQSISEKNK